MTDTPTWRAYVAAMVEKCQAHQDEDFYRLALPGWQKELERLRIEHNDERDPVKQREDRPSR
jgi:hypothetical protein